MHRSTSLNTTPEKHKELRQKTFKECLDAGCEYVVVEAGIFTGTHQLKKNINRGDTISI